MAGFQQIFLTYSAAAPGGGYFYDDYPFAVGHSLRELNGNNYAGSCLRVRRSSDNTEQDIGFSSGFVDSATAETFCSGTDGYVVTWYDQSGNANHATQSTTSAQPKIISSGTWLTDASGNKTVNFYNGVGVDALLYWSSGGTYQNAGYGYSFNVISETTTATRRDVAGWHTPSAGIARFHIYLNVATANRAQMRARRLDADSVNILDSGTNFTTAASFVYTAVMDWTNNDGAIYHDGSNVASNTSFGTTGSTSNTASYVTAAVSSSSGLGKFSTSTPVAYITESIWFNTNESSNRSAIETDIMTYYGL